MRLCRPPVCLPRLGVDPRVPFGYTRRKPAARRLFAGNQRNVGSTFLAEFAKVPAVLNVVATTPSSRTSCDTASYGTLAQIFTIHRIQNHAVAKTHTCCKQRFRSMQKSKTFFKRCFFHPQNIHLFWTVTKIQNLRLAQFLSYLWRSPSDRVFTFFWNIRFTAPPDVNTAFAN